MKESPAHQNEAIILHKDNELIAFLNIRPISKGHTQIIPNGHFETFELLPPDLASG